MTTSVLMNAFLSWSSGNITNAQQRLQHRLKQAQLSTTASFADIDFAVPRELVKSKFLELSQGQWVQEHLNLILVGPTGVGKTFLSSVLTNG